MELGLTLGYWNRAMPADLVDWFKAADQLGYDAVWTAESWGSDAFSPLVLAAAHTEHIKLGTGVVQLSARTPAATAMHAVTLDHISNGRVILGLGVSGPQVVEGWYGMPSRRPLARTREYVEILRRAFEREGPLEFQGEHYQLPYTGEGSEGLGKPLKIMTHPLRQIPIWIGAEGPKNVAQTTEIADGWLPLYYSPWRPEVYHEQIKDRKLGFGIGVNVTFKIHDDVEAALLPTKGMLAFYIGGMGAKGQNYHTKLMARMGFEEQAYKIQELFMDGRRDEAVMEVPTEFADEISIVGSVERIKDRLQAWEESAVTMINVAPRSVDELRVIAELVKG
ncbi:MAG: LLM class F420-dependent oxidoreductase [Acidimicrobiales bacterium]